MYNVRPRNLFGKKLKLFYRLLNGEWCLLPMNWQERPKVQVNQDQLNAFMDRLIRKGMKHAAPKGMRTNG